MTSAKKIKAQIQLIDKEGKVKTVMVSLDKLIDYLKARVETLDVRLGDAETRIKDLEGRVHGK